MVLIDGRTVYNPVFSGVYWDAQDTFLPDIERIEVIRGPGASIWGANAVNGVINIVTKNSKDTQGTTSSILYGTEETQVGARYGAKIGEEAWGKVYAKAFERDNSKRATGGDANDAWRAFQGGFRMESGNESTDLISILGDIKGGEELEEYSLTDVLLPPYRRSVSGLSSYAAGHLLGRWNHSTSPTSSMTLQSYYDYYLRDDSVAEQGIHTYDIDFTHRFDIGTANSFTWGGEYRYVNDRVHGNEPSALTFIPERHDRSLFGVFFQNDYRVIPETLTFTIGSKIEYDDFGGFNPQPTVRTLWKPHKDHGFWGAVSRAVRSPSRAQRGVRNSFVVSPAQFGLPVTSPVGILIQTQGSTAVEPEKLIAYEVGYRYSPNQTFLIDTSAFFNDYHDLESIEPYRYPDLVSEPPPPHLVLPLRFRNKAHSQTTGVEVLTEWHPVPWWSFEAWYSFIRIEAALDPDSNDIGGRIDDLEVGSPQHHAVVRSTIDLPRGFELDGFARYHDTVKVRGTLLIPSYSELSLRLGWHVSDSIDLSLVGQNLLHESHKEFLGYYQTEANKIERAVFAQVTWKMN